MAVPTKRVLLISYHFGANGATGGFRWHAMSRVLAQEGWQFDVVTASLPQDPLPGITIHHVPPPNPSATLPPPLRKTVALGKSLLQPGRGRSEPVQVVPEEAGGVQDREELLRRVQDLPIWKPGMKFGLARSLDRSVTSLLTLLDGFRWARRAEPVAEMLLREKRFSCTVVSSPPHMSQLVGKRISRKAGLPYIADYRDPWIHEVPELDGYIPATTKLVGGRFEVSTQSAADLVVHNTPNVLRRALASRQLPTVPRVCVPNGYDAQPTERSPDRDVFRVLFCGWLHPFMDVRVLFQASRKLVDHLEIPPHRFRLEFMGSPETIGPLSMADISYAYGMEDYTDLLPRGSREAALDRQERAAVLVAFDCPHPLAIAMKFYDYMVMRGHLLLIAEPGSALDEAARMIGSRAVSPEDVDGIVDVLKYGYDRWIRGDFETNNDPEGLFSRANRVGEIRRILESFHDPSHTTSDSPPGRKRHSSVDVGV